MWPLLIAVQLVELLWVFFTFTGVEHFTIADDHVHLDFLPFSHSVGTAVALAFVVWLVVAVALERPRLGFALGLGVVSHVLLDVIQHEPNIRLLPFTWGPRLGLNLQAIPLANLLVELAYGVACWWIFRGKVGLLAAIVIFNVLNIPLMFPQPGSGATLRAQPDILPAVILAQIIATWLAVWWLASPRRAASRGSRL